MDESIPPLIFRRLVQDHGRLSTGLQILQNFMSGRRRNADETCFIKGLDDAIAGPALAVDDEDRMQHANE